MNPLDIAIVIVVGLLSIWGLFKGIVSQLFTVLSIVAAFVATSRLQAPFSRIIRPYFERGESAQLASYAILFLVVLIAVRLGGVVATRLVSQARLGWANRLAGAAVGLISGILMCAAILLGLKAFLPSRSPLVRDSSLAPMVLSAGYSLLELAPRQLRDKLRAFERPKEIPKIHQEVKQVLDTGQSLNHPFASQPATRPLRDKVRQGAGRSARGEEVEK